MISCGNAGDDISHSMISRHSSPMVFILLGALEKNDIANLVAWCRVVIEAFSGKLAVQTDGRREILAAQECV